MNPTAKQKAWRAKFARMYGGKKKRHARRTYHVATAPRRSTRMARRHRRFGRRSGRGKSFFGLSTKGPVLPAMGILGLGAAYLFSDTVGNMIPVVNQQNAMIRNAAGGFLLAGPAGAAVAIAKGFVSGNGSSGTGGLG